MFVDAIRAMGVVSEQINFSKAIFNRLLPKTRFNDLDRFDTTNTSGIFRAKYCHTIYYFIVNNPGTEHPEYPSFHDGFVKVIDDLYQSTSFQSGQWNTIPMKLSLLKPSS